MSCCDQNTNPIFVGDDVRLTATFRDATGALVDPDTVKIAVKSPDGTVTIYDFNEDTIEQLSTGLYLVVIDATMSGVWYFKWVSTGEGKGAQPGFFKVEHDPFEGVTI